MGFDRSERQLKHVGNILQLQILIEAQHDDLPLHLRQLLERLADLAARFLPFGKLHDRRTLVLAFRRLSETVAVGLVSGALPIVAALVHRHPVQPGLHVLGISPVLELPDQLEKRFLHNILRPPGILQLPLQEPGQRGVVAVHQSFETGLVSFHHSLDQLFVRHGSFLLAGLIVYGRQAVLRHEPVPFLHEFPQCNPGRVRSRGTFSRRRPSRLGQGESALPETVQRLPDQRGMASFVCGVDQLADGFPIRSAGRFKAVGGCRPPFPVVQISISGPDLERHGFLFLRDAAAPVAHGLGSAARIAEEKQRAHRVLRVAVKIAVFRLGDEEGVVLRIPRAGLDGGFGRGADQIHREEKDLAQRSQAACCLEQAFPPLAEPVEELLRFPDIAGSRDDGQRGFRILHDREAASDDGNAVPGASLELKLAAAAAGWRNRREQGAAEAFHRQVVGNRLDEGRARPIHQGAVGILCKQAVAAGKRIPSDACRQVEPVSPGEGEEAFAAAAADQPFVPIPFVADFHALDGQSRIKQAFADSELIPGAFPGDGVAVDPDRPHRHRRIQQQRHLARVLVLKLASAVRRLEPAPGGRNGQLRIGFHTSSRPASDMKLHAVQLEPVGVLILHLAESGSCCCQRFHMLRPIGYKRGIGNEGGSGRKQHGDGDEPWLSWAKGRLGPAEQGACRRQQDQRGERHERGQAAKLGSCQHGRPDLMPGQIGIQQRLEVERLQPNPLINLHDIGLKEQRAEHPCAERGGKRETQRQQGTEKQPEGKRNSVGLHIQEGEPSNLRRHGGQRQGVAECGDRISGVDGGDIERHVEEAADPFGAHPAPCAQRKPEQPLAGRMQQVSANEQDAEQQRNRGGQRQQHRMRGGGVQIDVLRRQRIGRIRMQEHPYAGSERKQQRPAQQQQRLQFQCGLPENYSHEASASSLLRLTSAR
ncbi:hypothetical protein BN871_AM_00450 [Paenibacillus sp. P22]|nr:hypothetical protein BN871_AM_00450 [Paenibacillus sp. P22]